MNITISGFFCFMLMCDNVTQCFKANKLHSISKIFLPPLPPATKLGQGYFFTRVQWRIQDFPQGGAPTPKIAIIFHIFAENCMKMKEFGPPGGGARPWRPPWIHQCVSVILLGGVARPTPRREVGGLAGRGCLGPDPGGSWGFWPGGAVQAHTWAGVQTHTRGVRAHTWGGGFQAHTQGVQAQVQGGLSQHALRQNPPPPSADGYCCGQYASYWNAFLLLDKVMMSCNQ